MEAVELFNDAYCLMLKARDGGKGERRKIDVELLDGVCWQRRVPVRARTVERNRRGWFRIG